MILALFALAVIGLILFSAEIMWHIKLLRREAGRKYIHILSAFWVAFWPFFLNQKAIFILSLILLVGVLVVRKLPLGRSIYTIDRLTSGDWLFPIGISLAALLAPSPWIFSAALLHLSVADGLAGLIGGYYNVGPYNVMGHKKSVLGTGVFMISSFLIILWLFTLSQAHLDMAIFPLVLVTAPLLSAIAENMSPFGLDNISVPLTVILVLRIFQIV